jgi:hypothetical protein
LTLTLCDSYPFLIFLSPLLLFRRRSRNHDRLAVLAAEKQPVLLVNVADSSEVGWATALPSHWITGKRVSAAYAVLESLRVIGGFGLLLKRFED